MKMPLLIPGNVVALIAPARAVSQEEMLPFKKWVQSKGLVLKEGKHLYGRLNQFSGTDAERAEDFCTEWLDPEVKAVFCARGGYGSMRWTHLVPESVWKQNKPKTLVGFSDITTLHLELNRYGVETLHAMMAHEFAKENEFQTANIESLENALFTGVLKYDLNENPEVEIYRGGNMRGDLIGGNLSLLYAALGTPEQPHTQGKILFIEDLDEYLYHIDRMVVSLKRAGIFKGLAGLIVGDMLNMRDNAIPFGANVLKIVLEAVEEYQFPVLFHFPVGHGLKNYALKLNAFTTFDGRFLIQT